MKTKLGNLFKISSGGTPLKSKHEYYDGGDVKWVKTGDLKQQYLYDTQDCITKIGLEKSSAKMYDENTVLIAMYGATIGATSILKIPACTNQACAAFPQVDSVIPEYLYYFLKSKRQQFIKDGVGGAQPNISASYLKNVDFNLLDLKDQQRIVDTLNRTSEIITSRTEQLAQYDNLIKSRFVEMFGDPVSNPFNWREDKLCNIGNLGRGVSKHRPRNAPELLGGQYPLIQTGDVANADLYITEYKSTYSELGLKQSKMWEKGTLCITIAANIAKTSILSFDACFPDSVVGFDPSENTNNVFMHYWFAFFQQLLESQAPESAQKNINLKILSDLNVIVPPKVEQDRFEGFVHQVDKLKVEVQKSLDKTQLLFDSLMQKYFD